MTTLSHLRIRGYRRPLDVDLEMKPFSVPNWIQRRWQDLLPEGLCCFWQHPVMPSCRRTFDFGGIGDILTRG